MRQLFFFRNFLTQIFFEKKFFFPIFQNTQNWKLKIWGFLDLYHINKTPLLRSQNTTKNFGRNFFGPNFFWKKFFFAYFPKYSKKFHQNGPNSVVFDPKVFPHLKISLFRVFEEFWNFNFWWLKIMIFWASKS